jgi:hypothetical protein
MIDSGTWKKYDPKFLLQRWLERTTRKRARLLLPVSYQYYHRLLSEGIIREKMFVFPCVVSIDRFAFQKSWREQIRASLSIDSTSIVGIYVGKYGGLYYEDEAFLIYKSLFNYFGKNFFLILLTEMNARIVQAKLEKYQIPSERVFVSKVNHEAVPSYLSVSDFGISTIKSVLAMRFCSPIKHGEYWAADLPILSTLSVGDDAEIINNEGGGIIIDVLRGDLHHDFLKLKNLICEGKTGLNAKLASKYRNPLVMEKAIDFVLKKLVTK